MHTHYSIIGKPNEKTPEKAVILDMPKSANDCKKLRFVLNGAENESMLSSIYSSKESTQAENTCEVNSISMRDLGTLWYNKRSAVFKL